MIIKYYFVITLLHCLMKSSTEEIHDEVVLIFYSKSNDKPFPGKGSSERIPLERQKDFIDLSKISQWRKKLSNFWIQPFCLDGFRWNSVEHYYQASKFKVANHSFYVSFSADSGTALSKYALKAKQAGGKDLRGRYRPISIKLDDDFFKGPCRGAQEMYKAQFAKFSQNEDLKALLLSTKDATLRHFVRRGGGFTVFRDLMKIRSILSASLTINDDNTHAVDNGNI